MARNRKRTPMLFQGDMVRALLSGDKEQTRRLIVNPEYHGCLTGDCPHNAQSECEASLAAWCPYGRPGDLLWVREAFGVYGWPKDGLPCYRADNDMPQMKYKPSIHMPKQFSRLTLEITDVIAQPLQSITDAEAMAEGIEKTEFWNDEHPPSICYSVLWDRINGKKAPWKENPWVWAISFTVHRGNINRMFLGESNG